MRTRISLKILLTSAALIGIAIGGISNAKAGQDLRYATWDPPQHEWIKFGVDRWIKSIGKVTEGRVNVRKLAKGLGAPPAYHDFIRKGAIDVAHIIPAYTPGRLELHKVAEFPFLAASAKARTVAYWRVYEKHFKKVNEAKGMKLLNVGVHGGGLIHNTKRPITKMSDLKGMKLRVSGDNVAGMAKGMGATPIFASILKVHNMLSKGVADGVFLTFEGVKNFKLGKLVKYTTVPPGGLYATVFQMYMNQKVWDGISNKDQKLIESVSGEYGAQFLGAAWELADKNGMKHMKEMGIKITPMPAPFVAKAKAIWEPLQAIWMAKAKEKGVDGEAALAMMKAEIAKVESGQ
ncbi:MAG: TRAP transporter substrate-binding protein [Rhodospirillales bacterium]|jgi:TRAP-type C4-dicarboxylate transport system substrate-binding protein|nr:TRAP transporter substrate-binding protein [Rhodospirillales bacterium]MDC0989620.1 TRAP transporter substrate-binding protein [Rhodospirillales bacterium]